MELRRAFELLWLPIDKQLRAERIAEVFVDVGASESNAPMLALYVLDLTAKQIGRVFGVDPDTVNKMTQREQGRLHVDGKGSLALLVAAHPRFIHFVAAEALAACSMRA